MSLFIKRNGKAVFDDMSAHGVIADWREPDVIRIAPVPLYNSFEDIDRFAHLLSGALSNTTSS